MGGVDELVTHADVLKWLPRDVRRELLMALGPEQRGWYTQEEMERSDGCFVEALSFEHRERQYFRTDLRWN
jgi:hypothetical protein